MYSDTLHTRRKTDFSKPTVLFDWFSWTFRLLQGYDSSRLPSYIYSNIHQRRQWHSNSKLISGAILQRHSRATLKIDSEQVRSERNSTEVFQSTLGQLAENLAIRFTRTHLVSHAWPDKSQRVFWAWKKTCLSDSDLRPLPILFFSSTSKLRIVGIEWREQLKAVPQSKPSRDIFHRTPVSYDILSYKRHKLDLRNLLHMVNPSHLCKISLPGTCKVSASNKGIVWKNCPVLEKSPKDFVWNPGSDVCMNRYATATNIQISMRHSHLGISVLLCIWDI